MSDESERADRKDVPAAAPRVPGDLAAKVKRGIDDPDAARELRVVLHVEGGPPGERYVLHAEVAGAGETIATLEDDLHGRRPPPRRATVEPSEFVALLRMLDVDRLARTAGRRPRLLPDSVVGRLEVADGEQRVAAVFPADPEQAKAAGYELPPELAKPVDALYELTARQLDVEDVRP